MNLQQLNPWNWFTHEEHPPFPLNVIQKKQRRKPLHTSETKRIPIN